MIPKTIYQTYKTINPPDEFIFSRTSLIKLNPDYQYVYMNDEEVIEFIRCYYGGDILRSYLRINPVYGPARADLFRYLLIFEKGGVYFDIKSGANKPLSDIILPEDKYILSRWSGNRIAVYHELRTPENPDGKEYQNWHIIGEAKHPILERVIGDVIANINRGSDAVGKLGVLRLTGPIAYTKSIDQVMWAIRRELENDLDAGLRYNMQGPVYNQEHIKMMPGHYTKCTEPIILAP